MPQHALQPHTLYRALWQCPSNPFASLKRSMLSSEEEINAESSEDWCSGVMGVGSDIQTDKLATKTVLLDSAPSFQKNY